MHALDTDYDLNGVELQNSTARGKVRMSFLETLHEMKQKDTAQDCDPWRLRLERVQGKIDYDGLERVSSQTLLDILEVPQRDRRAGTYKRVCKLMVELGWAPVRVRDFARGGYLEQIRGYCRQPIHHS